MKNINEEQIAGRVESLERMLSPHALLNFFGVFFCAMNSRCGHRALVQRFSPMTGVFSCERLRS